MFSKDLHVQSGNKYNRKRCEIFLKLTIATKERRHWIRSVVFIIIFHTFFYCFHCWLWAYIVWWLCAKLIKGPGKSRLKSTVLTSLQHLKLVSGSWYLLIRLVSLGRYNFTRSPHYRFDRVLNMALKFTEAAICKCFWK